MQIVSSKPYLCLEERKSLLKKNNWLAAGEISLHLLWLLAAFLLVYGWANPPKTFPAYIAC